MKTEKEKMKAEELTQKAKNWKFDLKKISEEDLEKCLRIFHGNKWYEEGDQDDIHCSDAYGFIHINALWANGVVKTDSAPYYKEDGTLLGNLWQLYTHKELPDFPEDFQDWMAEVCDGYSDVELFEENANEEVQKILLKYNFSN